MKLVASAKRNRKFNPEPVFQPARSVSKLVAPWNLKTKNMESVIRMATVEAFRWPSELTLIKNLSLH